MVALLTPRPLCSAPKVSACNVLSPIFSTCPNLTHLPKLDQPRLLGADQRASKNTGSCVPAPFLLPIIQGCCEGSEDGCLQSPQQVPGTQQVLTQYNQLVLLGSLALWTPKAASREDARQREGSASRVSPGYYEVVFV
ncbi:uncharacterized protein ACBT57_016207 [Dama dama]